MEQVPAEAIHVVSSDSASGLAKQLGVPRTHVRVLSELLTIGPCDVDPARHVALRRAWNAEQAGETVGLDELRVFVSDPPTVIWAARAYADLIWLWWILDGLERLGPVPQPPFLVRPRLDNPLTTAGGATVEEALAALAEGQYLQADQLHEGAELWRRYASPDPAAFDEARRTSSLRFPEIHESAELHGVWFPRLDGNRLRVAEHDQLLLSRLTDKWQTTRDLIFDLPGSERLLCPFGVFFPIRRLRAWAARGFIAHESRSDNSPFEQDVFQLTDRTRALLESGLQRLDDAPTLYVGGCRLYDPAAAWVRVSDDSGWRLARI